MFTFQRSCYLWLALAVAGSLGGTAAWSDDLDDDQALTLEFTTPHTTGPSPMPGDCAGPVFCQHSLCGNGLLQASPNGRTDAAVRFSGRGGLLGPDCGLA